MDNKKLSLEEKVDLILKYHKSARRWAIVGGIFKLTVFFIFIVLPIILAVQFFQGFKDSDAYQKFQDVGSKMETLDKLDQVLKQLPQR